MLENIIPSKTRRKILQLYFQHIGEQYHLRRVAREVEEEINAVKRELDILEKEGILKKERRINKVIYSLNPKYYFFDDFLRIFTKQTSLVHNLLANSARIGKIKYIALSMKYPKNEPIAEGEIYLLIIGTVATAEVVQIIKDEEEKQSGREINYSVMTEEEFAFRKRSNDPFIWGFLRQPKVMIYGDEGGLFT